MFYWAMASYILFSAIALCLMKKLTTSLPKSSAVMWQFGGSSILAITFWCVSGMPDPEWNCMWIAAVGFVNAFGAYAQWQALETSLSKTSFLLTLSPIWATILAIGILQEDIWGNWKILGGIVVLHLAAMAIALLKEDPKPKNDDGMPAEKPQKLWLPWVIGALLIFGSAAFLMKVSTIANVPHALFLPSWYGGAFLGGLLIYAIRREEPLTMSQASSALLVGASIICQLASLYWGFQLADASVVLGIASFVNPILAIVLGIYVFHEEIVLSLWHYVAFALGIAGCVLIAVGGLYSLL